VFLFDGLNWKWSSYFGGAPIRGWKIGKTTRPGGSW
jgi:hypothetical protein